MKADTILLVEDNPDDEALTLRALGKCRTKNTVHVVRDGAEALDYLFATAKYSDRNEVELPQLVLLDLQLPKLDGHEVLKAIRSAKHTRFLPVVMLTSSKEENDLLLAYCNGVNSYVVKPVDAAQFSESVQQLGLYWLTVNLKLPAYTAFAD